MTITKEEGSMNNNMSNGAPYLEHAGAAEEGAEGGGQCGHTHSNNDDIFRNARLLRSTVVG